MKWSKQIEKSISKGRRLCSGLSFICRKLNREQFIKVMTSQFYSTVYCGCEVWLNNTTYFNDLRRLNSLHNHPLRIASRDFKHRKCRSEQDLLGRAKLSTWSRYLTASRVITNCLTKHSYVERRRPGRLKFYDDARTKIGRQTLCNRAGFCVNKVDFDWKNEDMNNDKLRICQKKTFNMNVQS